MGCVLSGGPSHGSSTGGGGGRGRILKRTNRISPTLNSSDLSTHTHTLSFEIQAEVTGSFVDMNRDVFLDSRLDIWKNDDLSQLVRAYFGNIDRTLKFCTAIEKCLKKAMDGVVGAQNTLNCFQEEDMATSGVGRVGDKKFTRTLEELRRFTTVGGGGGGGREIFSDEFFRLFESVRNQRILMRKRLRRLTQKLDKKLASAKTWRKVSRAISIASVTAILICSVVAAAMATPPVAAALAAVASVPLGSMGKWVDSFWISNEKTIEDQKKFVRDMEIGGMIVKKDLENITRLVDRMKEQMEGLAAAAESGLPGDEEAVRLSAEKIKRKVEEFMESVEGLDKRRDRCTGNTGKARTVILKKLKKNND